MNREGEVLGLAGVFQAVSLVRDLAHTGTCAAQPAAASIASVLRLDADSPAEVFGGVEGVHLGLKVLGDALEGRQRDPEITGMSATVLHLEPKLRGRPALLEKIREGVASADRAVTALGADHEVIYERLGDIYSATLSTLRPRVIVQGNGQYLSQPALVSRVRALLLAGVRAAVLWRQCGGSRWKLILQRRGLAEAARALLPKD